MIHWCGYDWVSVMEGRRRIHPQKPWEWYCDECAYVDEDQVLHLKVMDKPTEIHHWDHKTYNPTKAVGIVRTTTPFDYGTFSLEMKMPKGTYLSASFWLSGEHSWPPEIDIEEGWPEDGNWLHKTTKYFPWFFKSWRTTTNVHYLDKKGEKDSKTHVGSRNILKCKQPLDPSENFIEYKCIWKPDSVEFFANGRSVRKITGKVVDKLINNNENPDHVMDAIINIWTEDPEHHKVSMDTELLVKNFKYTPLEK